LGAIAIVLSLQVAAAGQFGTAPNNYYPPSYNGGTFTGTVESTTANSIKLVYKHGDRAETFEATAVAPCRLPEGNNAVAPFPLSTIKNGSVVTLLYNAKTVKTDGRKQKKYEVVGITVDNWNGKVIDETKRYLFLCVPPGTLLHYRAFGDN
jgi:hypothetical protein